MSAATATENLTGPPDFTSFSLLVLPAFFDLLRETLAQGHDASQRHLVPRRWWMPGSSPGTTNRSRGARRPRSCFIVPPEEGVGNAGCRFAPAASRGKIKTTR